MFANFQDYLAVRKPMLDDAFRSQLSILLGNIRTKESSALMATLGAGKKIRGGLSCLISDTLGGALDEVMPRAIAIELIQVASLIHDDFVDQDTVRRNRPAAWTLEGARRAVLIGDVIFATAIKMMNDLGREDGLAVSRAIAQVSRGALHEPLDPLILAQEMESNGIKENLYEKIIHLKTGILFGAACHLGVLAAKADGKLGEISYRYGFRIGEAYQIADDLKEVEHHLERRFIDPEQMAALASLFLYFVPDSGRYVLNRLKGKGSALDAAEVGFFQAAVRLTKDEIERRLQAAVSEIEGNFPGNEYTALVLRAPWDLIRMFNGS